MPLRFLLFFYYLFLGILKYVSFYGVKIAREAKADKRKTKGKRMSLMQQNVTYPLESPPLFFFFTATVGPGLRGWGDGRTEKEKAFFYCENMKKKKEKKKVEKGGKLQER
eukprot:TRINITY_DN1007_c2_g3_i1.p2 TRINITY_DN1007_c2_g3~~TRINITY_DN1007_c2_g3_i1.p2  ORF type:complete len:110 (+),score=4.61 TRINITY_DN1007_c2_g3_i1:353-682(+)